MTAVSGFLAAETGRQLSLRRPIDVVPNFIDPDRHGSPVCPLHARGRRAAAGDADAHLELPAAEAPRRRGADLRARGRPARRPARAGGRRSRVRAHPGAGRGTRPRRPGALRRRGRRGGPAAGRRPTCCCCRARPRASASWPSRRWRAACPWSRAGSAACPRWSSTASRGTWRPWETSTPWRSTLSRSSPTARRANRFARAARERALRAVRLARGGAALRGNLRAGGARLRRARSPSWRRGCPTPGRCSSPPGPGSSARSRGTSPLPACSRTGRS